MLTTHTLGDDILDLAAVGLVELDFHGLESDTSFVDDAVAITEGDFALRDRVACGCGRGGQDRRGGDGTSDKIFPCPDLLLQRLPDLTRRQHGTRVCWVDGRSVGNVVGRCRWHGGSDFKAVRDCPWREDEGKRERGEGMMSVCLDLGSKVESSRLFLDNRGPRRAADDRLMIAHHRTSSHHQFMLVAPTRDFLTTTPGHSVLYRTTPFTSLQRNNNEEQYEVRLQDDSDVAVYANSEVILCAGAEGRMSPPRLILLSGLGPPALVITYKTFMFTFSRILLA